MNLDRSTQRKRPGHERKLSHTPGFAPQAARTSSTKTIVVETIEYVDDEPEDEAPTEPTVMAIDRTGRATRLSAGDVRLLAEVYVGGEGSQRGSAPAGFMDMAMRMGLRFACGCRGADAPKPTMTTTGSVIVRDSSTPAHAPGCRFERSAEDHRIAGERDATLVHHLAPIRSGVEPSRTRPRTTTRAIKTRLGAALAHAARIAGTDRVGPRPEAASWQARMAAAIATMPFEGGRRIGVPTATSIHDLGRLRAAIMRDDSRTPDSQPHGLLLTAVDEVEDGALRIGHDRLAITGTISNEGTGDSEGPYIAAVLLASMTGTEPEPVEAYLIPCLSLQEPMPMTDADARRTTEIVREEMASMNVAEWKLRSTTTGCGATRLTLAVESDRGPTALEISVLASDALAATEDVDADRTRPAPERSHAACHATRPGANRRRADEQFRASIRATFAATRIDEPIKVEGAEEDVDGTKPTDEPRAAEERPRTEARQPTHAEYLDMLRAIGMQVDAQQPETIYGRLGRRNPSRGLMEAIGRHG